MKKAIKKFFAKDEGYYEDSKSNNSDSHRPDQAPSKPSKEELKMREFVLEKFKSRRSVRRYSRNPISWKCIYEIVDAALNAPCAGNIQNYSIIVIENKKKREEIARIQSQQFWISDAPVVLAVVRESNRLIELYPVDGEKYSIQNCSALIENLLMLAHFYGYGACWVEACDGRAIAEALGVPEDKTVDAIIPIGYPDEKAKDCSKERTMDKIYFESFGQRSK